MTAHVFIDGSAGTTGLRIIQRLSERPDIHLVTLPDELRKNATARADALANADAAILCLPDEAAVEAVTLANNPDTVIIDASTAHRTALGWAYGMPELHGMRAQISSSTRIANPGCHASGFIALVAPLISEGFLCADAQLSAFSITGYSGGGKKMIAHYEQNPTERDPALKAPRAYALSQDHKHLPEMTALSGLHTPPVFTPIVADFYAGLEVTIPIPCNLLSSVTSSCAGTESYSSTTSLKAAVEELYSDYYQGEALIHVCHDASEEGFLSANAYAERDDMEISVQGDDAGPLTLVARFDNLGKGASGAAIQNLNIALGLEETAGLRYGTSPTI